VVLWSAVWLAFAIPETFKYHVLVVLKFFFIGDIGGEFYKYVL